MESEGQTSAGLGDPPSLNSEARRWARGPLLAVALGGGLLFVAWLLASETVEIPAIPDAGHIAMHLLLFGGITALCVPALGPVRAFGVMMFFGVGVELAQMAGVGRVGRLLPEAGFDFSVDLLGGGLGLVVLRAGRDALRRGSPIPWSAWTVLGLVSFAVATGVSGRAAVLAGGFTGMAFLMEASNPKSSGWRTVFLGGGVVTAVAALWALG